MAEESYSFKVLKNSSWGFISYASSIVFSIFITPIIVRRLGLVDYGVYVFANTIMVFLGLLDLGLTTSVSKHLSELHAQNDFAGLKKMLNSANSLYWIIGVSGLLIFFLVGKFFLPFFHI